MAVFKEYGGEKDRSAEDRRRHRELVEESIRKNIGGIIAEESIIGQKKDKKVKIPIKGIKEYRFVFGKNNGGTGSGDGSEKRGDKLGEDKSEQKGAGTGSAGSEEGEDIYETEVTIAELIEYLLEELKLPDIDRKKLAELESIRSFKTLGYQRKGIPPRLAKKRSAIEKIKRKQSYLRDSVTRENVQQDNNVDVQKRFPFMEDDLRYQRIREDLKKDFNAVVICIMDVSGSMDQTRKFMARSFFFLLYQFILLKYSNVEVVFIAHSTIAKEVNEDEFFHRGESGGTYISSGYEKALEIIEQRYNPACWNIYSFHCSDGDNWNEDNKKAVELANKLCEVCNLFGYGEINESNYFNGSTIKSEYQQNVKKKNFAAITITKKEDVFPGLKKLLDREG